MPSHFTSLLLLAPLLGFVRAQTFTSCNPLNTTCPADPALGTTFNQTFSSDSSLDSADWTVLGGPYATYEQDGALFTINEHGDAPTIETPFYIFGGRVEVVMKAASGAGIVSSIVLLSDDLDEIDWEIIGSNTTHVETNYYGKGGVHDAIWYPCPGGAQASFHNYTTVWTQDSTDWYLDGNLVRSLTPSQVVNGSSFYPQTPMQLKIGTWAGGDVQSNSPGTVTWAGGPTDFDNGPFTMVLQSVKITDFSNNTKSYTYGDMSGSWDSIKLEMGQSDAAAVINAPPAKSLSQRWAELSSAAKIGIFSGIVAAAVLFLTFIGVCCIKQRRAGRRERAMADAEYDKEQAELHDYRTQMAAGKFSKSGGFVRISERYDFS